MQANETDIDLATTDLGPLAWVLDELRKSLDSASAALRRFVRDTGLARGADMASVDGGQLRIARQQLHQAVGALEMVGLGAPAHMLRCMEGAVQKFVDRPELCNEASAAKVERAGFALTEYLEGVLLGKAASAVALFPQYRDVQELSGADRVHPADLWTLEWRWNEPQTPAVAEALAYGPAVRSQMDQNVLRVVKSADPAAARQLARLSLSLAGSQNARQPKIFWKLCAGYFEAVAAGLLPQDIYVKRAASRVLMQYASLAKGDQGVSDRLALDLLFFCSQAVPARNQDAPSLASVRLAWNLARFAPVDYLTAQYGRFDPMLLAQARKRIGAAKETWSVLSGGEAGKIKPLADQFHSVSESLLKLHPASSALAKALSDVAEGVVRSARAPSAELAMEVATALLYLEAAFEDLDPADVQLAKRTARLAQRLDTVSQGGQPEALEAWMEELYRRVSDRQTMGSVVGELRGTLGELEKLLDQFFRNLQDKTPLRAVPAHLTQMRGVLSVLGLEQAAQAVLRMRESVEEFIVVEIDEERARSAGTFDKLGNNLGALGFLIDMLNYQPALAKKLFVYDDGTGELRPLMGRSGHAALEPAAAGDVPPPMQTVVAPVEVRGSPERSAADLIIAAAPPVPAAPAVPAASELAAPAKSVPLATALPAASSEADDEEEELRGIFLEEAREVVQNGLAAIEALTVSPADASELTTLRRAFHTLKGSSRMVGLTEFGEAGWSLEQVLNTWLADQKPASHELLSLAGDAMRGFSRWVDDIATHSDSVWKAGMFRGPADTFRTQNRLVALSLPDSAPATMQPAVAEPIEAATVAEEHAPIEIVSLELPAAEAAAPVEFEVAARGAPEPVIEFELLDIAKPVEPAQPVESAESIEFIEAVELVESAEAIEVSETIQTSQTIEAIETIETIEAVEAAKPAEPVQPVEPVETIESVDAVFVQPAETTGTIEVIESGDFVESVESPDSVESIETIEAALVDFDLDSEPAPARLRPLDVERAPVAKGFDVEGIDFAGLSDAAGLGFRQLPVLVKSGRLLVEPTAAAREAAIEPAAPIENVAETAEPDTDEQTKVIGSLRIGIPLYNVYLNEADEWSRRLATEVAEWALELNQPVPDSTVGLAHALAGSSATVGFNTLSDVARALEHSLQHTQALAYVTPQHGAAFTQAAEEIRRLLHQFAAGFLKEPNTAVIDALLALGDLDIPQRDELPDDEFTDDFADPGAQPPRFEPVLSLRGTPEPELPALLMPVEAPLAVARPVFATPQATAVGAARAATPSDDEDDEDDEVDITDAVDPDLFPIFEDEALELMPRLGGALRQWVARPENRSARDEVLRALHTLKGSARLAGALRLGELAHRMESEIEYLGSEALPSESIEPLLQRFDGMQASLDALRANGGLAPEAPAPASATDAQAAPLDGAQSQPDESEQVAGRALARPVATNLAPQRAASNQAVRVRSQLLDRLVNQAGEVMITRSRLEAELRQLRSSLTDLTGNLDRLRAQLRDIELQAESQMQSRLAQAKDSAAGFDPLEFDRFTRVQELTRMMAESVNDVATVQRSLQRTVESTEDDLIAQARQTRELQRDLLRTRMVEFESISDRLYRVIRLAAKESAKQVKLDITGGSIEMDRGVLDRMTPAFEHLLRNCVAHGIESPAVRAAAGKDPSGAILINLHHEGNDVSVEFRDDGAGLDLQRIRDKALQQGLIPPGKDLSEDEAAQLIFMPGFSTAAHVTELSGRGIGTDVVRAEVNALGGRIETTTTTGQGTSFKLVLPLTTAVTQVVMIRTGNLSVGVPANLVEIVRRATPKEVQQAYNTGVYELGADQLPFYWSGALLQASRRSNEAQPRSTPVVVFRSAAQRIAVHVDEVLGNQEVVVKNLGPQLARLPGLAGMTVLASGAVVLIYNPVALTTFYGDQVRELSADQAQPEVLGEGSGLSAEPAVPQIPLILVVDDSITVRRVTQRLLQREGYRVSMAADGLQALERLADEKPTVVLSDIEMPRMDGFDLARNIRTDSRLKDLPIIMITSRIAEKHREHARELGVDHYLGKPYSEEELLSLVKHYCTATILAA
jgi:chemosensory pili system protein ChpA (sensor histidine kinase/response regulator)